MKQKKTPMRIYQKSLMEEVLDTEEEEVAVASVWVEGAVAEDVVWDSKTVSEADFNLTSNRLAFKNARLFTNLIITN
jgi:hypothetical protein